MAGRNRASQVFYDNANWTAPAGVTQIRVVARAYTDYSKNGGSGSNVHIVSPAGYLYAWGDNSQGQLGDNSQVSKSSPISIQGAQKFKMVADGNGFAALLSQDGKILTTGQNTSGQLGDGTITSRSTPVAIISNARRIASGQSFFIYADQNADGYGTGDNTYGQLGDNSVTNRSSPVAVVGSLKWADLSCGPSRSYGIRLATGAGYAWGRNDNGEIGDNTIVAKSSPVAIVGGLLFKKIVGAFDHTLGLTTAGVCYAWGDNTFGQIGNGTNGNKYSSPVAVSGGLTFVDIAAGPQGSAGLTTAGAIYTWGANTSGKLGTGSSTPTAVSSPVLVTGGLTYSRLMSHASTLHGTSIDGRLYGWGGNGTGQIGDGSRTDRSSPVVVFGGDNIATLSPYTYETLVAVTPGTTYSVNVRGGGNAYLSGGSPIIPVGMVVDEITLLWDA